MLGSAGAEREWVKRLTVLNPNYKVGDRTEGLILRRSGDLSLDG